MADRLLIDFVLVCEAWKARLVEAAAALPPPVVYDRRAAWGMIGQRLDEARRWATDAMALEDV